MAFLCRLELMELGLSSLKYLINNNNNPLMLPLCTIRGDFERDYLTRTRTKVSFKFEQA